METLTFVTGNKAKAKQLTLHLDRSVVHENLDVPEMQSLEVEEVATQKAQWAFERLGKPVLVEDTALAFNALGGLPGPLVKWFLVALENKGMTQLLAGYDDRSAVAEVCFAYCDGSITKTFKNTVHGSIADSPRGEHGFGWDPIFIPEGHTKTWGEMTDEEQGETSMRRIALEKLSFFLSQKGGE